MTKSRSILLRNFFTVFSWAINLFDKNNPQKIILFKLMSDHSYLAPP